VAKLELFELNGKKAGEIEAKDNCFAIPEEKSAVVHTAMVAFMSGLRQGTHKAKNRGEVSGGGIKPWKQKGTGRARAGDNRSPLWRHGGKAFGPTPRDYSQAIPKKMKKLAIYAVLSDLNRRHVLKVVSELKVATPKTKEFLKSFGALLDNKKTVVVDKKFGPEVVRSGRNLAKVKMLSLESLNVYDLLNCEQVIMTKAAKERIEEVASA
jgi:large subunit ribosomal protein L4